MPHTSLDQLLDAVSRALRDADRTLHGRNGVHDVAAGTRPGPRLAELSMSFDFRLRYRRVARRRRRELVMQLGRPRFRWFDRRPVHRLHIVCLADAGWRPRVELDGRTIALAGGP